MVRPRSSSSLTSQLPCQIVACSCPAVLAGRSEPHTSSCSAVPRGVYDHTTVCLPVAYGQPCPPDSLQPLGLPGSVSCAHGCLLLLQQCLTLLPLGRSVPLLLQALRFPASNAMRCSIPTACSRQLPPLADAQLSLCTPCKSCGLQFELRCILLCQKSSQMLQEACPTTYLFC